MKKEVVTRINQLIGQSQDRRNFPNSILYKGKSLRFLRPEIEFIKRQDSVVDLAPVGFDFLIEL